MDPTAFFPPPSNQPPDPLIFEPSAAHTATIITIHGYGDDGYGWEMLPQRHRASLPHAKWINPSAPLDELVKMRSWFDISDEAIAKWREHGKKDATIVEEPAPGEAQMLAAVTKPDGDPLAAFIPALRYIQDLIDREINAGIPSERIAIVVCCFRPERSRLTVSRASRKAVPSHSSAHCSASSDFTQMGLPRTRQPAGNTPQSSRSAPFCLEARRGLNGQTRAGNGSRVRRILRHCIAYW